MDRKLRQKLIRRPKQGNSYDYIEKAKRNPKKWERNNFQNRPYKNI